MTADAHQDAAGVKAPRGVRLAAALGVRDAGRVLRDFASYLPTQAIPAIAGFIVLPIVARRLAPTELGVLAIAQTLITLGWTVSGSWLALSIIREYPASRERDDLAAFSRTFRRALAVSALFLAGFLGALALVSIVSSAVRENLLLIGAAIVGLAVQNVAVSLFAAGLRPRAYAIVEVLARTGGIAVGVALVFEGYKVQGYLAGLAAASLAVGAMGLWAAWPRAGGAPPREPAALSGWLRYGIPGSLAGLTLWGLFFVDRYLLAIIENTGAVGIYTVGNVIGDKAMSIPVLAFFTAASPLLITAFERHGRAEVERLMRAYTRVVVLIGLPLLALLAAVADDLVPLLAGERYYGPAADVVPVVALGTLFYALALVATTGLVVSKRTPPLAWAALVGLGVNVVANVFLIPRYGINGAAAATPVSTAAYLGAVHFWARAHVTWRFPFPTLVRTAAAAAAAFALTSVVLPEDGSHAARIAIGVAAVVVVYAAVLVLLGERRSSTAAA